MLLGNYSVLYKHPGRDIGGGAIGLGMDRGAFTKTSMARGVFNAVDWEPKSGIPDGYRPPYTWVIPQTDGGLASRALLVGTGTFSADIAGGKNAEAALTGSGDLTATGALIVQAVAALTGSGTVTTADLQAILNAVAALSGSGSLAASTEALGFVLAALTGTGTLNLTPYATGAMAADISPFTALSPEALAASVWNSLAADFNDAGTMGNKMNSAASAGDPWGTALPGAYAAGEAGQILGTIGEILLDEENIESGLTVREALRLISSALAGKLSGAATTTVVIRDVNDTKDRITATVDADGNRTAITTDTS